MRGRRLIDLPFQDPGGPTGLQLHFDANGVGFDRVEGGAIESVHLRSVAAGVPGDRAADVGLGDGNDELHVL
jgi:hypothetical protein